MITAVDSSVVLAIFMQEANAERWLHSLSMASLAGGLVMSEVAYAEIAAFFETQKDLIEQLDLLAIELLPSTKETLFLAGKIYTSYRRAGGARTTIVPDFLIGAHAATQADQLASTDRGFLRSHFAGLTLLSI